MFSTAGATASSGVPGARRATVSMAAMTVHAPVLSIFISSIRSDGLMLMPPESKQTPLPTIARCRSEVSRCPSPPERMTIIRGGLSMPRPTAMNMPMPSSGRARLDDVDPQTVLLGDGAGLLGEDVRGNVVGRAVRERAGVLAPSPMITPRSAAACATPRPPPGATRISSSISGGADSTSSGRSPLGRTCPRRRRGRRARRSRRRRPSGVRER